MREHIITGLDLGSSCIRCAVGKVVAKDQPLQIVGLAEVPSEGVFKGVVTSIEDTVASVTSCFEKVARMVGAPVTHAFLGISAPSIIAQLSKGVVAVSRADKEIHEDDVSRVIEAAQAVASPPNYEILHILPRSFTIDAAAGIKDPVGMTGVRLEVEALILQGISSQINTFSRVIHRTGIEIDDMVLGSLACAEAVLTRRQRELGVALVNIGASTLSLLIFQDGDLVHAKIFPLGAGHITSDIAIGLRIPLDLAERIKVDYGVACADTVKGREEISFQDISLEEGSFSRKYLAEIIEARCEEMCSFIDTEFKKTSAASLLPFGVVVTGGGAKLPGIIELCKRQLRLPASLGLPNDMSSGIDRVQDPVFTTALGLVSWGKEMAGSGSKKKGMGLGSLDGVFKRMFKSLMP